MPPNLPLSAVVLAAGRSSRMGRDKALLEAGGIPLWQRQREVLADAGAKEIFLSARPDQSWTREAKGYTAVVHDRLPGCGPIVGITAALERATLPLLAVLAIDLPAITSEWFQTLLGDCEKGRGVVGRRGDFFEPLAAIYPREAMSLFWEAIARNEYSLQALVARAVEEQLMRGREIRSDEEQLFANWNR